MTQLIDKIPAFLQPIAQNLIAAAIVALVGWLAAQGLIREGQLQTEAIKQQTMELRHANELKRAELVWWGVDAQNLSLAPSK